MAITADKMILYLSGGTSNTNPNNSLGGGISSTQLDADDTNTVRLQNLFSNRTASQASAGGKFNRCIFLKNTSSETATQVQVWQSAIQPAGDVLFLAAGGNGQGSLGDANGPVANETTLPWSTVGLFKSYPDATHTLSMPDLAAGVYCAVWVQIKLLANTARFDNDMFGLGFSWNSPS